MIISKSPLRISFFGGGTDFPEYFNLHGGLTLSTTIDKFCYVIVTDIPKVFDYNVQATYSVIERVKSLNELKHPSIRNTLLFTQTERIRIVYDADLPANSGLGSSSSFVIGLLNCIYELNQKNRNPEQLCSDSVYIERVMCGEDGGIQDQIAISYGGFNIIRYTDNNYSINKLLISDERIDELNSKLLLFFTGFTRFSREISTEQKNNVKLNYSKLNRMKKIAENAIAILSDDKCKLDEFGKLLDESWKIKKELATNISNDEIDNLYQIAINAGALGGKLLGSGGAGFLMFFVPKDKQVGVIKALSNLSLIPFGFSKKGSQIIYNSNKEDNK